jgi:hypothetical protein
MGLRQFHGITRPLISIEEDQARAYYERACASPTAAIAVLEANLRVRWSNYMFNEVVACSGNEPTGQGILRFLAETGLREQVLDVFASGQRTEAFLSLPNHLARRHWQGAVLGCQKVKPKRVLIILELCSAVLQFESDTGRITWRSEHALHNVCPARSGVAGREVWTVQPFRQIDWSELLVKELETPGGKCLNAVDIRASRREKTSRIRFVVSSS